MTKRPSVLLGAALACLTALAVPSSRAADVWTQENGGASAEAFNADQTILGADNVDQVTELWQQAYRSTSDTVESDGQLFVGYVGGSSYYLARLDPLTGASVWAVPTFEFMVLSPALTASLVIVTEEPSSGQASLVAAYDRATGKPVWHHNLQAETIDVPRVFDGVVYVTTTYDLVAFDAATGSKLWSVARKAGEYASGSTAVVKGVVVVSRVDSITAYGANHGHALWQFIPDVNIEDQIMVVDGMVVAEDEDGGVYAIDIATGVLRWKVEIPYGQTYTSMATDGQRVFVLQGETYRTHYTTALDLATGATLWSQTTPQAPFTPLASNGVLFMPTKSGILALDTTTGARLTYAKVPGSLYRRMTLAEGMLFVSDWQGGSLYAIGLPQ